MKTYQKKGDKKLVQKLSNVATIRTGLIISRKKAEVNHDVVMTYKLLNLKSIDIDGSINFSMLDDFNSTEELSFDYMAIKGDIILRYTEPFTAVCFDGQIQNVVVPSHFCIIRLLDKNINPKYVAHQLNSAYVRNQTMKHLQGTIIKNISPSIIGKIKLKLPSANKQNDFTEFINLLNDEKKLQNRLIELNNQKQEFYKNSIFKGEII